jgi:hypothetical protein
VKRVRARWGSPGQSSQAKDRIIKFALVIVFCSIWFVR